jgi:CDP-4-dehydro-6-deoxyglucose reductase, E1
MATKYNWPLADNNFSFWDRLKICGFFLNKKNRWTQDKYVREYERKIAEYVGAQYAVFVSSGSAANQLIAQRVKDELVKDHQWETRNQVILSAVSWQTNASVWIREGFSPVFIDIDLKDFALDTKKLTEYLDKNADKVACVFPTSVLGYTPEIEEYQRIQAKYKVKICFDNCENFFGEAVGWKYPPENTLTIKRNINNWFTCSTSGYLAHQINSGGESGIIFTNDFEEYKYFLLARAHGLSRNLKPYAGKTIFSGYVDWDINTYYPWEVEPIYNRLVNQEFNFTLLSSNYRNTDIAAFCSLLDLKKADKNKQHREVIYNAFWNNIDHIRYHLPEDRPGHKDIAFCLPIIVKGDEKEIRIERVKELLRKNEIECRPFISGSMLRHTPYQKYADYKDYPNAEYITHFACYIGLNPSTTVEDVKVLCENLNRL